MAVTVGFIGAAVMGAVVTVAAAETVRHWVNHSPPSAIAGNLLTQVTPWKSAS